MEQNNIYLFFSHMSKEKEILKHILWGGVKKKLRKKKLTDEMFQ